MSLTSYQTAPPRAMFGLRPATAAQPVRVPGENAFAHRNQVVGIGRGPANRGPMSGTLRPATPAESAHHGLARPGSDLLSHALRRSTIGAEGLHGRVRNGIGCFPLAVTTRPCKPTDADFRKFHNRSRLLDGPCRTGGRTTVRVQPVRPRHNKSWHGRMRVERRLRNTAFSAACAVFRPGPFGTGEGTSRSSD